MALMLISKRDRRKENLAWIEWELLQRSIVNNRKKISIKEFSEITGVDHRNLENSINYSFEKCRKKYINSDTVRRAKISHA